MVISVLKCLYLYWSQIHSCTATCFLFLFAAVFVDKLHSKTSKRLFPNNTWRNRKWLYSLHSASAAVFNSAAQTLTIDTNPTTVGKSFVLPLKLFCHPNSDLPDGWPSKAWSVVGSWVSWHKNNWLRHITNPSLIITGGRPKVRNYASICETVTLNATEQHIGNLNKFGSAYDGPRFSPNLLQFCPPSCENWPGQNCSPKNGP